MTSQLPYRRSEVSSSDKVAVVLGAGRSMTSGVAKGLHLAGFPMANKEGDLLAASPYQPHGHYEDRWLVELNDAILQDWGGSWNNPPDQREPAPHFINQAAAYIEGRGEPQWGMKDPRMVLTWPVWRFAFMHYTYDVILCKVLRDPVNVAESLSERDNTPLIDNYDLTCRYQTLLEEITYASRS